MHVHVSVHMHMCVSSCFFFSYYIGINQQEMHMHTCRSACVFPFFIVLLYWNKSSKRCTGMPLADLLLPKSQMCCI